MSTNQDNDMWQRIEDAFTPDVDELRRADKDLSRLQVANEPESLTAQSGSSAGRPKHRLARRVTLAATLGLLLGGIAWIGPDIITTKHFNELTEPDKVVMMLANPETDQSWQASIGYALGRVKAGLCGLQFLANSTTETATVRKAAKAAWERLQTRTARTGGDGNEDISYLYVTAIDKDTSRADKLLMVDNLERLTDKLIEALLTAHPLVPETCAISKWKVEHWLDDAFTRTPTWPGDLKLTDDQPPSGGQAPTGQQAPAEQLAPTDDQARKGRG